MKLFIYTFGCKINQYESQLIREKYCSQNYEYVDNFEQADVIIVNSCSVTAHADKQCDQIINKFHKHNSGAKIVLTGCYANVSKDKISEKFPFVEIKEKSFFLSDIKQRIKTFDNHSRAFVKIQDGCDNFCSYCIVPYARSEKRSKPLTDVLKELKGLVEKGFLELVLTGINIGNYVCPQTGADLAALCREIAQLPGKWRVRFSSIELPDRKSVV